MQRLAEAIVVIFSKLLEDASMDLSTAWRNTLEVPAESDAAREAVARALSRRALALTVTLPG